MIFFSLRTLFACFFSFCLFLGIFHIIYPLDFEKNTTAQNLNPAMPLLHAGSALLVLLLILPQVHAFGAGNIASISAVEGKNWRHGDIEDVLKTLAFISGHKWTSTMVKRVYFGNWLRD